MSERFTEDDVRRIFARAAERQHADEPGPPGLSLAELQEIGRSAGLDPAQIAAAVAEVRGGVETPEATFWGVDLTPRASRVLPGEMTEEAWTQMVARLRRTFKVKGVATEVGRTREWTGTNSQGGLSNLHVVAESVEGGTRVTLETSRAKEGKEMWAVPATFGVISLLLGILFAVGDFEPGLWMLPALFLVLGAVGTLGGRIALARWSDKRDRQFDALLDQFELIVRDATSSETTTNAETAAPRLDLDALAELEDERAASESRRRTRS